MTTLYKLQERINGIWRDMTNPGASRNLTEEQANHYCALLTKWNRGKGQKFRVVKEFVPKVKQ